MHNHGRQASLAVVGAFVVFVLNFSFASAQVLVEPGEQVVLDDPDDGDFSLDCFLDQCAASFNTGTREITVLAQIPVGIADMTNTATAFLSQEFKLTGDPSKMRILGAQINGTALVKGEVFTAAGIGGLSADIDVVVTLRDLTAGRNIASRTIFSDNCTSSFGVDFCRSNTNGNKSLNLSVDLIRSHTYRLTLQATCEASSGLIGDLAICDFSDLLTGDDLIRWNSFTVSVEEDIIELLENLQASVDMLKDQVAQHDMEVQGRLATLQDSVDENNRAILESIRLLTTPLGRRSSDFLACDGGPCDFPGRTAR